MKRKISHLFIILFSAFFFVLSSGVAITWHECCHKHQHEKTDHRHCHEDKIFIKIKDEFTKSEKTCFFFPLTETVSFLSVPFDIYEVITLHFHIPRPPLIKLAGVNFINFTSQRIFYS
jgi:hypothetical protein